jgi:hypothetical protein
MFKYTYPQGLLGYYRQHGNTLSYNPYFKVAVALKYFVIQDWIHQRLVDVGLVKRSVDWSTVAIEGISADEYTYTGDAYATAGYWMDGRPLAEDELEALPKEPGWDAKCESAGLDLYTSAIDHAYDSMGDGD